MSRHYFDQGIAADVARGACALGSLADDRALLERIAHMKTLGAMSVQYVG